MEDQQDGKSRVWGMEEWNAAAVRRGLGSEGGVVEAEVGIAQDNE